jgi:hypothetical protein
LFRVRVDLKVPGREIAVGRDPAAHHAHEDVYVAIHDAFDTARQLLEDYAREARGDVELHAVPDHGRITRLLPGQNCGFILSADGNEIYFTVTALPMAASTNSQSATRCVSWHMTLRVRKARRRVP